MFQTLTKSEIKNGRKTGIIDGSMTSLKKVTGKNGSKIVIMIGVNMAVI
jgi:hypothetical protein